jgi:hypothetical protein
LNAFLLIVHATVSKEGTDDGDYIECREPEISIDNAQSFFIKSK